MKKPNHTKSTAARRAKGSLAALFITLNILTGCSTAALAPATGLTSPQHEHINPNQPEARTAGTMPLPRHKPQPPVTDSRYGVPHPKNIAYTGSAKPGEIIINIQTRRLYLINDNGTAREYWIAVGAQGRSSPTGQYRITRKQENPSWTPTARMRARDPHLRAVRGGAPNNPLGPRAMYLGSSIYRIHGTNHPESIGHAASSGCFRLNSDDVTDLYPRVPLSAQVSIIRKAETPGIEDSGQTRQKQSSRNTP